MPTQADLLIRNGNIATLQGPEGPRDASAASDVALQSGWSVAVQGDRIVWLGPTNQWDGEAKRVVDAAGRLVTPGYVDSHAHVIYAGDRAFELGMKLAGHSYMDILAAGGGIAHTTRHTREASEEQLVNEAMERVQRMIRNGTTTLESKSGYALDLEGELKMLAAGRRLGERSGVNVVGTFLGAHAVPEEFTGRTRDYVDLVVDEMLPAVAKQGIARFCDVFVEEGVFTFEHGKQILVAARKLGLGLRLHADEIVNTRGAQLASELGCVSADHLLQISEEGVQAMASAGIIATLLPTVPIGMMKPEWPPTARLLEAGVPIALASDHNPNNPVADMGLVCQLGCYLLGLSPAQALTAATWNGACALGLQEDVGSIAVGRRADLLVHEVSDLDHWAYEVGRKTVDVVVLGGQVFE